MTIALAVQQRRHDIYLATRCKMGTIVANLNNEDKEAIEYAIEQARGGNKHFSNQWFATTLSDNGYPLGKTSVSDHLARRCACDRSQ